MSVVSVTNVDVLRNPCSLLEPFEFDVSFESLEPLKEDIVWRLVYVGDAEDKRGDQELDCLVLGPIPRGLLRFTFIAEPPDYSKIKKEDIPGITIILLTASYREQQFVRVGWYIHNVFSLPELRENPPDVDEMELSDLISQLQRVVLADEPRVTRFNIQWDSVEVTEDTNTSTVPGLNQIDAKNTYDSSTVVQASPPLMNPPSGETYHLTGYGNEGVQDNENTTTTTTSMIHMGSCTNIISDTHNTDGDISMAHVVPTAASAAYGIETS